MANQNTPLTYEAMFGGKVRKPPTYARQDGNGINPTNPTAMGNDTYKPPNYAGQDGNGINPTNPGNITYKPLDNNPTTIEYKPLDIKPPDIDSNIKYTPGGNTMAFNPAELFDPNSPNYDPNRAREFMRTHPGYQPPQGFDTAALQKQVDEKQRVLDNEANINYTKNSVWDKTLSILKGAVPDFGRGDRQNRPDGVPDNYIYEDGQWKSPSGTLWDPNAQNLEIELAPDATGDLTTTTFSDTGDDPGDVPGEDLQTSLTDAVQDRLTGKSEDIKSMEATYNRDVSRMRYSAMQEARSLAAQKGYAPGSEQYNQLMRNANQQINDAEQSGRESLFKNVRGVRTEAIAQATTLADILWSQKRTAGLDDQQKLKDLMATVPHAAVKNILGTMNWSQAEKFMKEATYPQGHEKAGQFKDEYYDNNWDQMYTEATNLARAESLKDGTPFDPESEASKTIIGNQMYNLLKAQARPGETASDDADNATAVETLQNLLKAGSTPTSAQVIAAIDSVAVDKIPAFSATAKVKVTDNGGWMNVNNKAIQVIDGGSFKRKDATTWRDAKWDEYAVIKYDGKTYYFTNKGEWYDSVPTKALKDGGKQITNPLK